MGNVRENRGKKMARMGALLLAGMTLFGTVGCQGNSDVSLEDWANAGNNSQTAFVPYTGYSFEADCVGSSYREHTLADVAEIMDIVQTAVDKGEFTVDFGEDVNESFVSQAWLNLIIMNPKCAELQFKHIEGGKYELWFCKMEEMPYTWGTYFPIGMIDSDNDGILDTQDDASIVRSDYLTEEEVLLRQQELTEHVENFIRENISINYTDEEKASVIYQYMVENFELVSKVTDGESGVDESRLTLRDAILNEYGTAQLFSMVYRFYLDQLGVDAVMINDLLPEYHWEVGEEFLADYFKSALHILNAVYIVDEWYLMDVTYDIAYYRHALETTGVDELPMDFFGMSRATKDQKTSGGTMSIFGNMSPVNRLSVPGCPKDLYEDDAGEKSGE